MGIIAGEPPANGKQIVTEAVKEITISPGKMLRSIKPILGTPQITQPISIFSIGADELDLSHLLQTEASGWRYFIIHNNKPLLSAELELSEGKLTFSNVALGVLNEEIIRLILQAEEFDEVQNTDFELRLLKIPALNAIALWLFNEEKESLIIPILPNESLVEKHKFSVEDFFAELQPNAQMRHDYDDRPLK